ncbi:MAG: cell wall metabolism sensor histidine kinase WalK [Alicyclobacillus herbarius]|uniref:HAMP domain-containing sensor histidine kinase n=1 Tax=Alicyclobacillus herbarius TaxID=122960 RepID=UPI0004000F3D|nr:ATP-binding protein [Alicyclobacillus herbarius]MCL6631274.1 cell wall metabolism sensor histidine kinase WalK [Alicyclobacillus herbarius]
MIRNSIVAKLWLTIVGMVVVVLALLSILLQQFFDNYVYRQQARQLSRLAQSVQVSINNTRNPTAALQVAQQMAYVQQADIHVTLSFDLTSNPSLASAYQRFTPEQRNTFLSGKPVVISGESNGIDMVSVYLRLNSKDHPGMLEVWQNIRALDEPISLMRNLIIFAMVLGILLTTGLAFVVSKNLSRPLLQMNEAAEQMVQGNFHGKIDVVTNDEVGRLGRTFNVMADELKQTIAALSFEKEQLSNILASLHDGVVAADLDGHITLANPPARRRLQSTSLATTGVPDSTRLPVDLQRQMEAVIDARKPVTREWSWQARDILVTMTPLYQSDGQTLRGVVAVLRDISEERRLDRLRKDFLANVSHELRTPLSMMQGYAEALLDEFGDDPEQRRELTGIIHDEALRMKRLVNDLLDLAQLESGQFQMTFKKVNITEVVRRVVRKFQTLAGERGIHLDGQFAPEAVCVRGDEDRLEQVFTNLVDNALRHTDKGGEVRLTVRESAGYAQIEVRDTGSGIPEEDIPYIWERFYKADKARTRGRSGTGLGLAITRHIVEAHDGDIVVNSQLGKGTTFTVSIPLVEN